MNNERPEPFAVLRVDPDGPVIKILGIINGICSNLNRARDEVSLGNYSKALTYINDADILMMKANINLQALQGESK